MNITVQNLSSNFIDNSYLYQVENMLF